MGVTPMRRLLVVFLLLISVTAPALAQGSRRVALVIGNNDYKSEGRLQNAVNDAQLVAAALKTAKFETIEAKADLGIREFLQSLRQFQRQADGADVALIYFSGHGVEANGNNWLIPTDAVLAGDRDLEYEAIRIDLALQALAGARMRIMVLDACRNNPFGRNWRAGSRNLSRGLRAVDSALADDVLLLYAAAPGQTASDGAGSNSPFATALAKRLPEPGLAVQLLGGLVRDDVIASTGGTQRPYIGGSFTGRPFYLVPAAPIAVAPPVVIPLPPPPALPSAEAAQAWTAVQSTSSEWALETFIRRYGDTFYGDLAKGRLEELKRARTAAAPVVAPPAPQTLVAPATPKTEPRPADAAKSVAPKAAVPKVALATPPSALTAPKPAFSARAHDTCRKVIADPIEQLAPVLMLMRGPGDDDIIEAKVVEVGSACRSLAATEPANELAVLFATIAESLAQYMRIEHTRHTPQFTRVVDANFAKLKLLADTGNADAMAAHAMAYLFRAEEELEAKDKARDMQEGLRLARAAADKGSPWAAAALALIQLGPDKGFKNFDDGLKWLRVAAAKGPPGLTAALGFVLREARHEALRTPELGVEGIELLAKAGERGSRIGRVFAALATIGPDGTPGDLAEATRLIRQFADAGGPMEQFLFARALAGADDGQLKDLIPSDPVDARTRLTAAVKVDDPLVTLLAANLLASGDHMPRDVETAVRWYQQAAHGGNAIVTLDVAKRFLEGGKQLPRFLVEGHRFLLLAAEQGDGAIALRAAELATDDIERARLLKLATAKSNPETAVILAGKLAKGDGMPVDLALAAQLFTRAAETGGAALAFDIADSVPVNVLGGGMGAEAGIAVKLRLLRLAAANADGSIAMQIAERLARTGAGQDLSMDPVAKSDAAEAVRLYKRAAETTADAATLLKMARVFVNGGGVPADREVAARLYRRAAEAGGPDIALEVALAFGSGLGVFVNQVEAAKWLAIVAKSEQTSHILAAAEAYAAGKIVPKDEAQATRLFKLVAEKGDRANKFIVANRFLNGVGVPQNAPDGIQILRSIADEHVGAMDQLAELYDKGSTISQDVGESAKFALRALQKRGSLSTDGFDKYSKSYSLEFRKAVQTALKASKHYTGAIDGNFGPAVKKALEAFAK